MTSIQVNVSDHGHYSDYEWDLKSRKVTHSDWADNFLSFH